MKELGFSRTYIIRFLGGLQEEGRIVRIGEANRDRCVEARKSK
jgi:hypothetical protein